MIDSPATRKALARETPGSFTCITMKDIPAIGKLCRGRVEEREAVQRAYQLVMQYLTLVIQPTHFNLLTALFSHGPVTCWDKLYASLLGPC